MPHDSSFLKGLIVPAFTPFKSNDTFSLNLGIIPEYVEYLVKKGASGVLICGTVGEGEALSVAERKSLTEEWSKAVKSKLHLMVHVGGAPLPDVLELARHAESLNVDSLLTLPELYFRPSNEKELATYLKLVSDAAPKSPLVYYFNPKRVPLNINIVKFLEEYGNQIPTLVGIKYAFTDLQEAKKAMEVKNKFTVIFVNEELIYSACILGAESFMMPVSNLLPELSLFIPTVCKDKDFEKAHKGQELLTKAFHVLRKYGNGLQGIKLAMNHFTSLNLGDSRIPWNRFSPEDESKMIKELKTEVFDKMKSLGL